MTTLALPTRRDEDFRYADLAALAPLWPVAVETIEVAAGGFDALTIVASASAPVRSLAIALGAGARGSTCAFSTPGWPMAGSGWW